MGNRDTTPERKGQAEDPKVQGEASKSVALTSSEEDFLATASAALRTLLRYPTGQSDVPSLADPDTAPTDVATFDQEEAVLLSSDANQDTGGEDRNVEAGHGGHDDVIQFPALLHTYRLAPASRGVSTEDGLSAGEAGRLSGGKLVVQGVVRVNPALLTALQGAEVDNANPKQFPMVVPPKPWRGIREGGYLRLKVPVLRPKLGSRGSL